MRFSQRHGYTPIKTSMQVESIDADLRTALWNSLTVHYWHKAHVFLGELQLHDEFGRAFARLCNDLWMNFLKHPIDAFPPRWDATYNVFRKYFFGCKWSEVYDFIEIVPSFYAHDPTNIAFRHDVNLVLEREVAGYRFVDDAIAPITSTSELQAIEEASTKSKGPVADHLSRATQMLSDRRDPDYRNSIKESISAVEAQVRLTLGTDTGTLGDLLKQVESKGSLHPALKSAFSNLYGYTSDADGIRHALTGKSDATFEEAKFMLVACSAFINYVKGVLKN